MYVPLHVSVAGKKDAEGKALDSGYIKDSTWIGLLSSNTPFFLGFGRNTPALVQCCQEHTSFYKEEDLHVLAGDGVKQYKEGCRMPGVKKLFQESENPAKPEYIHGHMFGSLGILVGASVMGLHPFERPAP